MQDSMTFEEALIVMDFQKTDKPDLKAIKAHYRLLARVHHPDKGGDSAAFVRLQEAYTILMKGQNSERVYTRPQTGFHTGGPVSGFNFHFQSMGADYVVFDFERLSASFRSAFRQTRRLKRELEVQIEEYAALKLGCPVGISITPVGYYIVHINHIALISAIPLGDGSELAKAHIDEMSAKQTQYRDVIRNRESQEGSKCKR